MCARDFTPQNSESDKNTEKSLVLLPTNFLRSKTVRYNSRIRETFEFFNNLQSVGTITTIQVKFKFFY